MDPDFREIQKRCLADLALKSVWIEYHLAALSVVHREIEIQTVRLNAARKGHKLVGGEQEGMIALRADYERAKNALNAALHARGFATINGVQPRFVFAAIDAPIDVEGLGA